VDTQGTKATEREQDDTHAEGAHGVWVTDEEVRGRIQHGDRLYLPATVVIVNGQVMVQLPHVDGVPDRMIALHREWFDEVPADAVGHDLLPHRDDLLPHRDDVVAAWLRERRGERPERSTWASYDAIDALLDEYRLRADLGLSLTAEIPEGAS
jgi:hypothetical protein